MTKTGSVIRNRANGHGNLSPIGSLLREWRRVRGVSQMELALAADVSAKHISFLETGRAEPTREMVLRLSQVLTVPLRDRNALLQAAGFAAPYRATPLEGEEKRHVRQAIDCILAGLGNNPSVVVNHQYDVVMGNPAAMALLRALLPPEAMAALPINMVKLMLSPDYLRPVIENWEEVALAISHRLQREVLLAPGRSALQALMKELSSQKLPQSVRLPDLTKGTKVVIPVRFRKGDLRLSLFGTITTLGTPMDITVQEIRIGTYFPADAESERTLERIVAEHKSSEE